ncbi:microfibril-associated glycoprotein 4-like [Mercenaria mercenaria]|uniref:microfibril-associated glycoprotein 4-like n=1 Tax=Mercenaria mercenaria TaxID=6596 RepID=UPI00234EBDBD|nr:microfibril-associated glycoprotein 4-like [Mercenaria mercenaria]
MSPTLLVFALSVRFVTAQDSLCIPVVKMQASDNSVSSGGKEYVTKEHFDDLVRQLFVNISGRIGEYKYESELAGKNCATKEDIKEMLRQMYVNISTEMNQKRCEDSTESHTTNTKPRDCQDIQTEGNLTTGTYTIYPCKNTNGILVRCDMNTTTGEWTVIQRRTSNTDFYKTWNEYEEGFGNIKDNFWLGNRHIHAITNQGQYKLRVDLTSLEGETAYAEYREFSVGDADSGYKLFVAGYSGTAGDSLTGRGNGMKFSTHDRDNDVYGGNCAVKYHGGWWYDICHTSNLNGEYGYTGYAKGPVWQPWKGYYAPMKTTEMKVRRI